MKLNIKRYTVILSIIVLLAVSSIGIAHMQNFNTIPSWIKTNAEWWSNDQITDEEYITALEYLIEEGIIKIENDLQNTKIIDNGIFYITYDPNPNTLYDGDDIAPVYLYDNKILEYEIEFLNEHLRLPYDVEILATECGEVNAFYDQDMKQIIICYEFVDDVFDLYYYFNEYDENDDYVSNYAYSVIIGAFYHELGHALIDIYELPISGLEENVVDQFSVYMLDFIVGDDEYAFSGAEMILANGYSYDLEDSWLNEFEGDGREHTYHDVHGLDAQRKYNMYCWGYGSNVTEYEFIITDGHLPEERAYSCELEYEQIVYAWNHFLDDYDYGFFSPDSNMEWESSEN